MAENGRCGCFRDPWNGRDCTSTNGTFRKSEKCKHRSWESFTPRGSKGTRGPTPRSGAARRCLPGAAGRPPRPTPPCRRTQVATRPRRATVPLRIGPLLPRRPPPPASRRRGSSGQAAPPSPPPPPLPPLQPFGRCVTRRFLPTWRPGQVGGDGGQSAAAAGVNPHSSQGSRILSGFLRRRRRRLVP